MENIEKDILSDHKELKKMPFATPDGYFENFKVNVSPSLGSVHETVPLFTRLKPYIAMAAMFAIIAAAGTGLMKIVSPQDDLQEYGAFAYIDMIPVTDPDAIYCSNYEDDGISEEDLIEYLIYDGTDLETIEKR